MQREFISGRFTFDFYDRLQVFVNSLAQTDFDVKQPKYDIFFSFSSKNHEEASQKVQVLRQAGLVVFFSSDDLQNQAGKSFIGKINQALQDSKHFLLHYTPQAIASPFVQHECETFFQEHIESQKKKRIFILRGQDFSMDLLRKVHFQHIQVSEIPHILQILGKQMPKNDVAERQEVYRDLFELFYEDGIISERERKQLEAQRYLLKLRKEDILPIEEEVKNAYYKKVLDLEQKAQKAEAERQAKLEQEKQQKETLSNLPEEDKQDKVSIPKQVQYAGLGGGVLLILIIIIMNLFGGSKNKKEDITEKENTSEEQELEDDDESLKEEDEIEEEDKTTENTTI